MFVLGHAIRFIGISVTEIETGRIVYRAGRVTDHRIFDQMQNPASAIDRRPRS